MGDTGARYPNPAGPVTARVRLHLRRLGLTYISVLSLLVSGAALLSSLTAANATETAQQTALETAPAFGVTGEGVDGICAEIESTHDEPLRLNDCASLVLRTRNLDLDYPAARPRAYDVLVENSVLRAGQRASFSVLGLDERPSYLRCAERNGRSQYWLSFGDLPGHTLCVRTDEGRIGLIQPEKVDALGTTVHARLTVWDKR